MKPSPGFLTHPLCEKPSLQEEVTVLKNEALGGGGFVVTLKAPGLAKMQEPGQFVHTLVPGGQFLRRPFSLMDANAQKGLVWIYGRKVGEGSAILAQARPGATLDLLGPLGHPFELASVRRGALLVAGGTGAGVLYMLARVLGLRGLKPKVLYGARNKEELSLLPWWKNLKGVEILCSTDDGSLGQRGTVVDLLKKAASRQLPAASQVYVCGPTVMMSAAARFCEEKGLECRVSLEQRMGCAVGACYACAFPVKDGAGYGSYIRVCRQGTVFDAKELDWDRALGEAVGRR